MLATYCKILFISLSLLLALSPVFVSGSDSPEDIIGRTCSSCHSPGIVYQARKSENEWENTINRMIRYGARLTQHERETIIHFLSGKK
ncbi:MAG: hypothetical protein ACOYVJ_06825 [Nitrospirota bacterium]